MHSLSFSAFRLFQALMFLFLIEPLLAAQEKKNELQPITLLEQALQKIPHSKPLQTLSHAYQALKSKHFEKAVHLSSKVFDDPSFADYAYWIAIQAHNAQAEHKLNDQDFSSAFVSAKKSNSIAFQIEGKNPYSPLIRILPKEVARSEFLIANAYWGMKKRSLAQHSFEIALQRLQNNNILASSNPSLFKNYLELCKKEQNSLCLSWLQKLYAVHGKKSDTIKALPLAIPALSERMKLGRPSVRAMLPYKAPDLDQVAFESALKLYLEEKYDDAIKSFRLFLDNFPRSSYRYRVRYLLAQSHENQKQTKQAQTLYEEIQQELPLSYYGFLSASKTTKSIDSVIDPNLPLATDSDSALQPQDIVHLTRAKQFLAAEIPDLASYELKELRSYESLSSPFLVYVAMLNQKAGNYRQCFGIFGELLQRGYPGVLSYYLFQMAFPMIFVETINKYSIENNIDPILIISVIKQESAFDEDANSGVGAMGLMQLMPYTALEIEPRANLSDLLTAEKSIQIGTKYLKKLLTRFNGNIILALAAYNAGPNAVDRWVKDLGTKRASLDFIESIPYKQTREYVSSIIRNYYWYSRRFKKTAPRRIDYFWNPASYQKQEGLQEPPFPSPLPSPTQQSGNA